MASCRVIRTVVVRVCLECGISLLKLPILWSYCRQSIGRTQSKASLITIEMKIESGLSKIAFNWFADVKDTNRKTDLMVKCQHHHWRFVPVRLSRHSIGRHKWSIISNFCLFDHGHCLSKSINETPPSSHQTLQASRVWKCNSGISRKRTVFYRT